MEDRRGVGTITDCLWGVCNTQSIFRDSSAALRLDRPGAKSSCTAAASLPRSFSDWKGQERLLASRQRNFLSFNHRARCTRHIEDFFFY